MASDQKVEISTLSASIVAEFLRAHGFTETSNEFSNVVSDMLHTETFHHADKIVSTKLAKYMGDSNHTTRLDAMIRAVHPKPMSKVISIDTQQRQNPEEFNTANSNTVPSVENPTDTLTASLSTNESGHQSSTTTNALPATSETSIHGSVSATSETSIHGSVPATSKTSIHGSVSATSEISIHGSVPATSKNSIHGSVPPTTFETTADLPNDEQFGAALEALLESSPQDQLDPHELYSASEQWTKDDTEQLKRLVAEQKSNPNKENIFDTVAKSMHKTPSSCRSKWEELNNGDDTVSQQSYVVQHTSVPAKDTVISTSMNNVSNTQDNYASSASTVPSRESPQLAFTGVSSAEPISNSATSISQPQGRSYNEEIIIDEEEDEENKNSKAPLHKNSRSSGGVSPVTTTSTTFTSIQHSSKGGFFSNISTDDNSESNLRSNEPANPKVNLKPNANSEFELTELSDEEMDDLEEENEPLVIGQKISAKSSKGSTNNESCSVQGIEIDISTAAALREILFGIPSHDQATGWKSKSPPLKAFNTAWLTQGFEFSTVPGCGWGLKQFSGGPCGALAVLQAHVAKHLYFPTGSSYDVSAWYNQDDVSDWRDPPDKIQTDALVSAIVEIIWRAGSLDGNKAVFAVPSSTYNAAKCQVKASIPMASVTASTVNAMFAKDDSSTPKTPPQISYQPDGFTEKLILYPATTQQELETIVRWSLPLITKPRSNGLAIIAVSAMLSRGLGIEVTDEFSGFSHSLIQYISPKNTQGKVYGVLHDMDTGLGAAATLIGAHNYATQELVNLLLTGKATSNVFDGRRVLDEASSTPVTLHGITTQSDIGFLTLFEHYGHMEVGAHYKQPRLPIWVICAESHYTTTFAPPKQLQNKLPSSTRAKSSTLTAAESSANILQTEDVIALHYWDGLARQDEPVQFTLSAKDGWSTNSNIDNQPKLVEGADLDEAPLDLVLRTRWKNAVVDWNGVEPWL